MYRTEGRVRYLEAGGCTATVLIRSVSSQLVALKLSHSIESSTVKLWHTHSLRHRVIPKLFHVQ